MIVICLDESGSFEGTGSSVRLIGGLIYKAADQEDYLEEMNRIERYLQEQCSSLGLLYPMGIHAKDMKDNTKKSKLKSALISYFKNSGRYYFTLIIKSKEDKDIYLNDSNLVDEKFASNLYEHMAWSLINNILFYNPNFKDEREVSLEVATRSIPVDNGNVEEISKYKKLGYNYNMLDKETWFYLTDQQTFKTAISAKMIDSHIDRAVDAQFNVKSINYFKTDRDKKRETTPWLYFADLVCDILRDYINPMRMDFNIEKLAEETIKITGNSLQCWAYDNIDEAWASVYENCLKSNYVGSLKAMFEFENQKSYFTRYYREHWISSIEEDIRRSFEIDKLSIYVDEVRRLLAKDTVHSEENPKNSNLGLYLGQKIWDEMQLSEDMPDMNLKYKLADLLLMGYNHRGNVEKAKEFFNICRSMASHAKVEDYCGTLLNYAQTSANEFDYDSAIAIIQNDEKYVTRLKSINNVDINDDIFQNSVPVDKTPAKFPLLGKIYSSLGQFHSFKREKAEAYKLFENALQEFENPSFNRQMTVSFILHLALDSRDRGMFDDYVKEYLGSFDPEQQLGYVLEEKDKFKFFVFIKALNIFCDQVEDRIIEQLVDFVKDTPVAFLCNSHPWQIIYKYMAMLFYKHNNTEMAELCKSRIKGVLKNKDEDLTLTILSVFSELVIMNDWEKDRKSVQMKLEELKKCIGVSGKVHSYFEESFRNTQVEAVIQSLKEKITFNYV